MGEWQYEVAVRYLRVLRLCHSALHGPGVECASGLRTGALAAINRNAEFALANQPNTTTVLGFPFQ